jgi:hypothetical protein
VAALILAQGGGAGKAGGVGPVDWPPGYPMR